jgi:hypothetical protein
MMDVVENCSGRPGLAAARYVTRRSAALKERRCGMLGWTAVIAGLIDIFGKLDAETLLQGGREGAFGRET